MALQRITHTGAAPPTGLGAPISASAMSLTLTSGTGYPTGAGGPFVIDIDAATPSEEKILCLSLSGGTITVAPGGRGFDGTAPAAHNAGSTNVTHVITSAEADDSNAHIYVPSRDDHSQYVRTDGSRGISGGLTIAGGLTVGGNLVSSAAISGQTVAASQAGGAGTSRYVGTCYGAAPSGGPWDIGDFAVDQLGAIWVCTASGTPGTWAKVGGSGSTFPQTLANVENYQVTTTSPIDIVAGTGPGLFRINCHARTTAAVADLILGAASIDERGSTFTYFNGTGTYWNGQPVAGAASIPCEPVVIRAAAGQTAYLQVISSVANVVYVSATLEQLSNT